MAGNWKRRFWRLGIPFGDTKCLAVEGWCSKKCPISLGVVCKDPRVEELTEGGPGVRLEEVKDLAGVGLKIKAERMHIQFGEKAEEVGICRPSERDI